MKILVFISGAGRKAFVQLEKILTAMVPTGCLHVSHGITDLSRRLRNPWQKYEVAVFAVTSNQELDNLISLQSWLEDLRIILILTRRDRKTTAKGHVLRPRFLTFADDNFKDVAAVLGKTIGIVNQSKCSRKDTITGRKNERKQ